MRPPAAARIRAVKSARDTPSADATVSIQFFDMAIDPAQFSHDPFSEAIQRLYAAATGEAARERALDACLSAVGFDGAALYVMDREFAENAAESVSCVRGLWHRLDP